MIRLPVFLLRSTASSEEGAWPGFTARESGDSRSTLVFTYVLMCVTVVREPSVPERDRDGKTILSYPILRGFPGIFDTTTRHATITPLFSAHHLVRKIVAVAKHATFIQYPSTSTM
jgi:hypothetical protein